MTKRSRKRARGGGTKNSNQDGKPTNMIILPPALLSFPQLDQPRAFEEGEKPEYSAELVFNKDDESDLVELKKKIKQVAIQTWGGKPRGFMDVIRDGDDKELETHEGTWFVKARTLRPPVLKDSADRKIEVGEFYAGCIVRALVMLKPWKFKNMKAGIRLQLVGLQLIEQGEPIGGDSTDAEFGEFEDGFVAEDGGEFSDADLFDTGENDLEF